MPFPPAAATTIFALSSGRPPAAVAVVRISGPRAGHVLDALAGFRPAPRRAAVGELSDPGTGELLDRALILWLPGPNTVTGEDVAELHLHGGRAVVDGALAALGRQEDARQALPGEFTRRAFDNGRIDLNEAEGLADLLAAETQGQRRAALLAAGGGLSRRIEAWQTRLLAISAAIEAAIDYSDEDDVGVDTFEAAMIDARALHGELDALLARPRAERLKDGVRVVVAGPPNSGKSSLINALAEREAAIESPIPGTTRDLIEVPVAFGGNPFLLIDTAGLRDAQDDVEAAGIVRATRAAAAADILLWLGDDEPPRGDGVIALHARSDARPAHPTRLPVSARTGQNLEMLVARLVADAANFLPVEGDVPLNNRQFALVASLAEVVGRTIAASDPLIVAEEARHARSLCDRLSGRAGVEDMLDSLFSRFCVGK